MIGYEWLKRKYKEGKEESVPKPEASGADNYEKEPHEKEVEMYTYDDWMDAIIAAVDPDALWDIGDLIAKSELLPEGEKVKLLEEIQTKIESFFR
jgi:hypothetical protein